MDAPRPRAAVEPPALRISRISTQNRRGEWVPAIPLPFYGLRKRCTCGRKFWTAEGYRGHYALHHAMGLD
jgi:hypothetical protein